MSDDRHIEDLLPAYPLGSLDPGEEGAVRGHLRRCASCRARLAEYEEVVGALGFSTAPAEPPAELRERILAGFRVAGFRADGLRAGPVSRPRGVSRWLQGLRSAPKGAAGWAAAGVLAVLCLAVLNVLLWQRVQHLETRTARLPYELIALDATPSAPAATGVILYSRDASMATLMVEDLPPLDPGQQYQLWLIRGGKRASGGVFSVSPNGYATLAVTAPLPLGSYETFGITVEPAGGSPGPTGRKVLGGKV